MKNIRPKVVSLFSGAGGIDLGFHRAGFEVVFSTDIWRLACDTIKRNSPSTEVVCDDISNIKFTEIAKKYASIDIVVGGPPCPPFSKSRFYRTEKKRGLDDVDGFKTVTEYFRAIKELRPKIFFFENVHGFVYRPHMEALDYFKAQSKNLGYSVSYQVVNAADFGVAQTRERFICIGTREPLVSFEFPSPTHSENPSHELKRWITCGDILSDLDVELPGDEQMQAGSKHKELLKLVPPGDNYLYFTKERGYPKPIFKWRSRYWSFLLKLSPARPSWTIQASHSNNMGPFHWRNRFLRIAEIKRIQSFPDEYEIVGNYRDQWRQIGNAVPPILANVFAVAIRKQYFSRAVKSKRPISYALPSSA